MGKDLASPGLVGQLQSNRETWWSGIPGVFKSTNASGLGITLRFGDAAGIATGMGESPRRYALNNGGSRHHISSIEQHPRCIYAFQFIGRKRHKKFRIHTDGNRSRRFLQYAPDVRLNPTVVQFPIHLLLIDAEASKSCTIRQTYSQPR